MGLTSLRRSARSAALEDSVDYCLLVIEEEQKGRGGSNRTDYAMTADAAKHIVMMSNKEKAKEVRRYFIEVEKAAQSLRESVTQAWQRRLDKTNQKIQMIRLHDASPENNKIYTLANTHVNAIVDDIFGLSKSKKATMTEAQLEERADILARWVDAYEMDNSVSHANMVVRIMYKIRQVGKNSYLNKAIEARR